MVKIMKDFIKKTMYNLCEKLFPICRSITGDGVRKTLNIIKKHIHDLKIIEVSTGEKVFEFQQTGVVGRNIVFWNGRNRNNKIVASGIYLYCIEAVSGEEKGKEWSKCVVVR